jgi:hypothetical protein
MKFNELKTLIILDCFHGYGLKMDHTGEEVFDDSARFYFMDSREREWQIHLEIAEEDESILDWWIYEKVGEDWYTSCSGGIDRNGKFL